MGDDDVEQANEAWRAYPSLLNEKRLAKTLEEGGGDAKLLELQCIVTEKVDGSNFAVVVSRKAGIEAVYSRTRRLEPNDKFHGLQTAIKAWEEDLVAYAERTQTSRVVFYGEVFGKWFPSPNPAKNGKLEGGAIQSRVAYSPRVRMVLFDAMDADTRRFHSCTMWESHPLFVRVLFRGTFAECAAWSEENRNRNTMYSEDGHGGVQQQAEGVILRFVDDVVVGADADDQERLVFKIRADAFRDDGVVAAVAEKPPPVAAAATTSKSKGETTEKENPYLTFVTPNWFANFLSKHANVDEFRGKRFPEFLDAALVEIGADADAPVVAEKQKRGLVAKALMQAHAEWVGRVGR